MSDDYEGPEKQVAQILSGMNKVVVLLHRGYSAAVFVIGKKPPTLVISDDAGEETWTITLTAPRDDQSMTITHPDKLTVEVEYKDVR